MRGDSCAPETAMTKPPIIRGSRVTGAELDEIALRGA
jgi:hypothetical protein